MSFTTYTKYALATLTLAAQLQAAPAPLPKHPSARPDVPRSCRVDWGMMEYEVFFNPDGTYSASAGYRRIARRHAPDYVGSWRVVRRAGHFELVIVEAMWSPDHHLFGSPHYYTTRVVLGPGSLSGHYRLNGHKDPIRWRVIDRPRLQWEREQ